MNEKEIFIIEEWKKRNNLTRKDIYINLLEAYRRIMMFHNGNINTNLANLSTQGQIKKAVEKGYFKTYGKETPRIYKWYSLTDKGKKVVKDLISHLKWDKNRMNKYLYNL